MESMADDSDECQALAIFNDGIDIPVVMRTLFLIGTLLLLIGIFGPRHLHPRGGDLNLQATCLWPAGFLLDEGCLYLLYVKVGKFRHSDFMLEMQPRERG
jgi:arsenite methyltransferase